MSHPITTSPRLPLGTLVKDADGRIGEVFDTGLDEDFVSTVYYVRDRHGEWKTTTAGLIVLSAWPIPGGAE